MCIHVYSLCFTQNSFLPEDYFPDNLTLSSICLSLSSKILKTGCDIRSAKVKTKAENTEREVYLLWLTVSNHIHNINVFPRPQGQITDFFGTIKKKGEENLTLDCEQGKVHICVAWYLCWREKLMPEQDKGYPGGTGAEGRQREGGGWWVTGQRLDLSGSIGD